ncbi:HD-GYP domain-containing protein [Bacillus sp. AFS040349]|uniref:HD-GYP domain-containing protein n=1 Tax=Bacillus sp. AFS040349 TaxID=2033502 RepID=UPI000BFE942F|nr:HD domain-containing phosphohydrolase [Bacillus sp. AFS040349]PGT82221.1 hypothetical protein COD11_15610 [Bacillus sp. AFS040349]
MKQTLGQFVNWMPLHMLWEHDLNTFQHSLRVADLFYEFGKYKDFPLHMLNDLYEIGVLHDIGKISVPKSILAKRGKLTPEELTFIYSHTTYGEMILKKENYPKIFLDSVKYHHENIDGSGYHHIKGDDIPYIARMLRIVDSFDAMTNDRVYQKSKSISMALLDLEEKKGTWYEPDLVNEFVQMYIDKYSVDVDLITTDFHNN